jgi:hypothetical protein
MQHSALVRRLRNELLAAARIAAMRMEAEAMSGRSQFDVGFEAGYARALAQFAAELRETKRALKYFETVLDAASTRVHQAEEEINQVIEHAAASVVKQ